MTSKTNGVVTMETKKHLYLVARAAYISGRISSAQAINMLATDPDFISGACYEGEDPVDIARKVVLQVWNKES